MDTGNKITLKPVNLDDPGLPLVIQDAIGDPSSNKILEVIKSYDNQGHEMTGVFLGDALIGMLGTFKANDFITIRHICVLHDFRRRGVGTLLLNEIKKLYTNHRIIAETDEDSVVFYTQSGFSCHGFKGQYGNLRYKCEFGRK